MGNLSLFLKKNKIERKNSFYAATKSLCDENGNPLMWEIRPITTKMSEKIREECTYEVPVKGKPGQYRQKYDGDKYIAKLICSAVVYPDLNSTELQDSYGVMKPEDLIQEMIDDPTEYSEFAKYITEESGLEETMNDKVEEAKN